MQENYYSTDSESDEEVEEVVEVENDQPAQGEVADVEIKEEPVESEDESQSNTNEPQSAKEKNSQMVRIIYSLYPSSIDLLNSAIAHSFSISMSEEFRMHYIYG